MNAARTLIESLRTRAATATSGLYVYLNEDSELDKQAAAQLERLVALVERYTNRERHWTVALTVAASGTTEALTANMTEMSYRESFRTEAGKKSYETTQSLR